MNEFECPTCGRQFDTRRGLGVHHVLAHNERLPNRTCAHCDGAFYSDYEKKYCSLGCRESAVSFEGERNPNYRGAKRAANCRICGSEFEYYPSDKEGLFCAECVDKNEWQNPPGSSGPDTRDGRVERGQFLVPYAGKTSNATQAILKVRSFCVALHASKHGSPMHSSVRVIRTGRVGRKCPMGRGGPG